MPYEWDQDPPEGLIPSKFKIPTPKKFEDQEPPEPTEAELAEALTAWAMTLKPKKRKRPAPELDIAPGKPEPWEEEFAQAMLAQVTARERAKAIVGRERQEGQKIRGAVQALRTPPQRDTFTFNRPSPPPITRFSTPAEQSERFQWERIKEAELAEKQRDLDINRRQLEREIDFEYGRTTALEKAARGEPLSPVERYRVYKGPRPTVPVDIVKDAPRERALPLDLGQAGSRLGRALYSTFTEIPRGAGELLDATNPFLKDEFRDSPGTFTSVGRPLSDKATGFIEKYTPVDPRMDESWAYAKIPSAIGSGTGFALAGAGMSKLPSMVSTSILGSMTNVAQVVREADARGINPQNRDAAIMFAAMTGLSEGIGLGRAIDRFGLRSTWTRRFWEVFEEGGQEALSTWLNNINAVMVGEFEKKRALSKGVVESAILGGIVGGMFQGVSAVDQIGAPKPKKFLGAMGDPSQIRVIELGGGGKKITGPITIIPTKRQPRKPMDPSLAQVPITRIRTQPRPPQAENEYIPDEIDEIKYRLMELGRDEREAKKEADYVDKMDLDQDDWFLNQDWFDVYEEYWDRHPEAMRGDPDWEQKAMDAAQVSSQYRAREGHKKAIYEELRNIRNEVADLRKDLDFFGEDDFSHDIMPGVGRRATAMISPRWVIDILASPAADGVTGSIQEVLDDIPKIEASSYSDQHKQTAIAALKELIQEARSRGHTSVQVISRDAPSGILLEDILPHESIHAGQYAMMEWIRVMKGQTLQDVDFIHEKDWSANHPLIKRAFTQNPGLRQMFNRTDPQTGKVLMPAEDVFAVEAPAYIISGQWDLMFGTEEEAAEFVFDYMDHISERWGSGVLGSLFETMRGTEESRSIVARGVLKFSNREGMVPNVAAATASAKSGSTRRTKLEARGRRKPRAHIPTAKEMDRVDRIRDQIYSTYHEGVELRRAFPQAYAAGDMASATGIAIRLAEIQSLLAEFLGALERLGLDYKQFELIEGKEGRAPALIVPSWFMSAITNNFPPTAMGVTTTVKNLEGMRKNLKYIAPDRASLLRAHKALRQLEPVIKERGLNSLVFINQWSSTEEILGKTMPHESVHVFQYTMAEQYNSVQRFVQERFWPVGPIATPHSLHDPYWAATHPLIVRLVALPGLVDAIGGGPLPSQSGGMMRGWDDADALSFVLPGYIMEDNYRWMTVTDEEAAGFMFDYMDHLMGLYGPEIIDIFDRVTWMMPEVAQFTSELRGIYNEYLIEGTDIRGVPAPRTEKPRPSHGRLGTPDESIWGPYSFGDLVGGGKIKIDASLGAPPRSEQWTKYGEDYRLSTGRLNEARLAPIAGTNYYEIWINGIHVRNQEDLDWAKAIAEREIDKVDLSWESIKRRNPELYTRAVDRLTFLRGGMPMEDRAAYELDSAMAGTNRWGEDPELMEYAELIQEMYPSEARRAKERSTWYQSPQTPQQQALIDDYHRRGKEFKEKLERLREDIRHTSDLRDQMEATRPPMSLSPVELDDWYKEYNRVKQRLNDQQAEFQQTEADYQHHQDFGPGIAWERWSDEDRLKREEDRAFEAIGGSLDVRRAEDKWKEEVREARRQADVRRPILKAALQALINNRNETDQARREGDYLTAEDRVEQRFQLRENYHNIRQELIHLYAMYLAETPTAQTHSEENRVNRIWELRGEIIKLKEELVDLGRKKTASELEDSWVREDIESIDHELSVKLSELEGLTAAEDWVMDIEEEVTNPPPPEGRKWEITRPEFGDLKERVREKYRKQATPDPVNVEEVTALRTQLSRWERTYAEWAHMLRVAMAGGKQGQWEIEELIEKTTEAKNQLLSIQFRLDELLNTESNVNRIVQKDVPKGRKWEVTGDPPIRIGSTVRSRSRGQVGQVLNIGTDQDGEWARVEFEDGTEEEIYTHDLTVVARRATSKEQQVHDALVEDPVVVDMSTVRQQELPGMEGAAPKQMVAEPPIPPPPQQPPLPGFGPEHPPIMEPQMALGYQQAVDRAFARLLEAKGIRYNPLRRTFYQVAEALMKGKIDSFEFRQALEEHGMTKEDFKNQFLATVSTAARSLQELSRIKMKWLKAAKIRPELEELFTSRELFDSLLEDIDNTILGRDLLQRGMGIVRMLMLSDIRTAVYNSIFNTGRIALVMPTHAGGAWLKTMHEGKAKGLSFQQRWHDANRSALNWAKVGFEVILAMNPAEWVKYVRKDGGRFQRYDQVINELTKENPDLYARLIAPGIGYEHATKVADKMTTARQLIERIPGEADRVEALRELKVYEDRMKSNQKRLGLLLRGAEIPLDLILKPMRWSELMFRKPIFTAYLERALADRGMNLQDMMAKEEMADVPPEVLDEAIDEALDFTYAYMPHQGGPGFESAAHDIITGINKLHFLNVTLGATFPRAMYNGLKFLYEYSPAGALPALKHIYKPEVVIDPMTRRRHAQNPLTKKDYDRVAKGVLGTILWGAAAWFVLGGEQGDEWWKIKTGGKDKDGNPNYLDIRRYQPMATMIRLADLAYRAADGRLNDIEFGKEVAEAMTGIRRFPGVEELVTGMFEYWEGDREGKWNKASTSLGTAFSFLTRPLMQLRDAYAAFSEEENKRRDLKGTGFLGPLIDNIPWVRRRYPELKSPTKGPSVELHESPALSFIGLRFVKGEGFAGREWRRLGILDKSFLPPNPDPIINRAQNQFFQEELSRIEQDVEGDPSYHAKSDQDKAAFWAELILGDKGLARFAREYGMGENISEAEMQMIRQMYNRFIRKSEGINQDMRQNR